MAKMSITFDGFADLADAIDRASGDLKKAVNEALSDTQKVVQDNVQSDATIYARKGGGKKGYATGAMYDAIIKNPSVDWKGSVAEVGVGFSTNGRSTVSGFMHSIFVMYGTPRMKKDTKVYNAIKGKKTRDQIEKVQEEVMQKYLKL